MAFRLPAMHVLRLLRFAWPRATGSPIADRLNAATKYVVTHWPESLAWGPFAALRSDLTKAVRRLKAQDGPDLIVSGSSTLTSTLMEHGLADEMLLIVYPVLLGQGKRILSPETPAHSFELASTKALAPGTVLSADRFAGGVKYQE